MSNQHAEIDLEHLENVVKQSQFHTIHWESDEGYYILTNPDGIEYRWQATPPGQPLQSLTERRGLRTILDFIETTYPAFYAYLVTTYPKNNKESEESHD
jgi:hypothetical protein